MMIKILVCFFVTAVAGRAIFDDGNYDPSYSYQYGVKDQESQDIKSQWETREGDRVKGSYRLVEPDGSVRTVEYIADDRNGFNAIVTRERNGLRHITQHGKRDHGEIITDFPGSSVLI